VPISHLTVFTVIAYTTPASFEVTGMAVTPAEVYPDETVTVSATITNTGDLTGSFEVIFKIDNTVIRTQTVTIHGRSSQTVNFSVNSGPAGEHAVSVNGLSSKFKVKEPMPEDRVEEVPISPAPASFTISNLSITPDEVNPSEEVTISALVTNIGGSDGSYIVVLKIDDIEETRKEVMVRTGTSETVIFIVSKDRQGNYTINIDGNIEQFIVIEEIIPSVPVQTSPMESEPTREYNWGLIIGIVAGGVVFIALLFYLTWRRKRGVLR
jgi:hypothetical protein